MTRPHLWCVLLLVAIVRSGAAEFGADLKAIVQPASSRAELDAALAFLKSDPSQFSADRLAAVADDPRFTPEHRARAFIGLFEVYFTGSFPLSKLLESDRVRSWITSDTIEDATMASVVPVRRAPGLGVFRFQRVFGSELKGTVYFTLNANLTKDELLSETRKPKSTVVWVVDIAPSSIVPFKGKPR